MAIVCFYRVDSPTATLMDKIIGLFTFGPYSHVEIVSDDGLTLRVSDRINGARLLRNQVYDSKKWDFVCLDIDVHDRILEIYEKYKDYKYDYIGAIFSAVPKNDFFSKIFCRNNRVFCSEVVYEVIYNKKDGCKYSPNRLYKKLIGDRDDI
jgi:hypothetical protein